jgi:hypothetical protein
VGVLSRWLVSTDYSVEPEHRRPDGLITDGSLRGWAEAAVESYLDRCPLVRARVEAERLRLSRQFRRIPSASGLGRATAVLVTATAIEFLPSEFVVAVRVRPSGGETETPMNLSCVIRLEDAADEPVELGTAVRDELIALEHTATHFN